MATSFTKSGVASQISQITWGDLDNGDTGDAVEVPGRPSDICVTCTGNSSDGVTIQGSDDNATWTTEADVDTSPIDANNSALSAASGGRVYLRSAPRYIRPVVASGSAFTGDIILTVRGQ
jgi:hypothetical protein